MLWTCSSAAFFTAIKVPGFKSELKSILILQSSLEQSGISKDSYGLSKHCSWKIHILGMLKWGNLQGKEPLSQPGHGDSGLVKAIVNLKEGLSPAAWRGLYVGLLWKQYVHP